MKICMHEHGGDTLILPTICIVSEPAEQDARRCTKCLINLYCDFIAHSISKIACCLTGHHHVVLLTLSIGSEQAERVGARFGVLGLCSD